MDVNAPQTPSLIGSAMTGFGVPPTMSVEDNAVMFSLWLSEAGEGITPRPRDIRSTLLGKRSKTTPVLKPGRIYHITMAPRKERSLGAEGESIEPVTPLLGGCFYLLYIGPSETNAGSPQPEITEPQIVVEDAATATLSNMFRLTVPRGAAAGESLLELHYSSDSEFIDSRVIARLLVRVDGPEIADQILGACKLTADAPPERVAILHVTRGEKGLFRVRAGARDHNGDWHVLDWAEIDVPDLSLAKFVEKKTAPEVVPALIQAFSRTGTAALQSWLRPLLHHGMDGDLKFVICDHTLSEFPWELLGVSLPDDREVCLGMRADVARWVPIEYYAESRILDLQSGLTRGAAVAYIEDHGLAGVETELWTLASLAIDRQKSFDDIIALLRTSPRNLGLLYLASHGTFVTTAMAEEVARGIGLGSSMLPGERLSLLQLESLPIQRGSRPLLFVNACHSGRISERGKIRLGLPDVLLGKVASAYIGTLGPVGSRYAAEVARRFLEAAAREEGVCPASFLRNLRTEALETAERERTEASWTNVVYAFSYVLYGSPLARLHVCSEKDLGKE